jgi:transposase-like protein
MKQSNKTKTPRVFISQIPEETKIRIIEDFRNQKNNSTTDLARKYGISYYKVDHIINTHLKSLSQ